MNADILHFFTVQVIHYFQSDPGIYESRWTAHLISSANDGVAKESFWKV
jgi:hypothetical protein